jgi:hypothetical protein
MVFARGSAGRRLALAGALAGLAVLCVAPRVGAAPDARARLARLTRRVAEHAARHAFEAVSLPGALRGPDIVPVTAAVIDSDRAFRAGAARELAAIEPALPKLDVNARADAAVLADWLARARVSRDSVRTFESDPGAPWPRIDAALRALLLGKGTPLCHRLGIASRRLRAIPEALRAEKTVLDPSRASTFAVDAAIQGFERTRMLLRTDIPAGVRECRDPGSVAALAEADSVAARAVESYLDWLRTVVQPRATAVAAAAPVVAAGVDSVRAALTDSLLRVYARGHANSVRATLGTRDAALEWADYVMTLRYGRDLGSPATGAPPPQPLESLHSAAVGPRFSPRAFLNAVIAEGPVPPSAVHDAVLRRLGVH